jgi:primosomal protein N' (replication factor Y)
MSPYVEVAVGLPVAGTFHYAVPDRLAAGALVGARVLVPFGNRGVTGVVVRADVEVADGAAIKSIRDVLDAEPAMDPSLVELCLWIADYYEAPPGEVVRAALPAGTQVAAAATLGLTEAGQAALGGGGVAALSRPARRLLEAIAAKGGRLPGKGTTPGARSELIGAGLVTLGESRRAARVKPRVVATVRLLTEKLDDAARAAIARAPRRAQLVAALEQLPGGGPIDRTELLAGDASAGTALRALVNAGLAVMGEREAARDAQGDGPALGAPSVTPLPPTAGQAAALAAIDAAALVGGFAPFLLHGITGSGKTEVYLQAIASVLERGKGAVVLVPEIALTPQLAARFRARFGAQVAVLHSGLGESERYEQWRRLRSGEARIALGARSAVFAPVAELGIVVVDEEHDSSFKQEEGVRYHARDVALVRAQKAGAIVVLGSATPSLESFANAQAGRYTLLELQVRPTARPLPEVEIVDLRQWRADGDSYLTAPLDKALDATLAAGEQAILFLNRRGFSTFVNCVGCGHAFRCPQCSVSLTYHRAGERLRCHYCGHSEPVPTECPLCHGDATIVRHGLGTEKVESALAARFPHARIGRLDRDTAAGKGLADVLSRVARREIDILVGTQMVTKGHDFPGVTLVGVLCADGGLAFPDFRAGERTFQLLTQVAGRAGRGDRPGRVIVQTWSPTHAAVRCAQTHDYKAFVAEEMVAREELDYPPRGRLIALRIDGPSELDVRATADALGQRARELHRDEARFSRVSVMGPAEAPLARLKGRTRWHLWARSVDRQALRVFVRRLVADRERFAASVRVTVDVDPMSAL